VTNSEIHLKLRAATASIHARLHGHEGFAAAAAGTIDLTAYCDLLGRLLGFHRGFEILLSEAAPMYDFGLDISMRRRALLIEEDLNSLGIDPDVIAALPLCTGVVPPDSPAQVLGSLYVVEGSTLGGLQIARALEPIVLPATSEGRRFFRGYGARHGAMWREFLKALDRCVDTPAETAEAIEAARATFLTFEDWMADWRGAIARGDQNYSRSRSMQAGRDRFVPTI
jgi:heme oxygenase